MNKNIKIPKIIHYCWFGRKRKPKLVRDCIKSWKKHCPDYKIIEWNEKNTDLRHSFVKYAYEQKKWAYVSDYVRLTVLYENGGIYLDTDMLLLKSLDMFNRNDCFFGAEDKAVIGTAIIGSIKKNEFIKKCIELYEFIDLGKKIDWHEIVNTIMITQLFKENYSFFENFETNVRFNNITIYPINTFFPFPYIMKDDIINYKEYIKPDSYAVHLWVGSWIVRNEFKFLRNGEYSKGFKLIYQKASFKNLNVKYLRKIASAVKESLSKSKKTVL